ncbi:sugar transferase [Pseudooceanicola sp. MF1-13]|uniref:sugar transferase n=1 Tax=Pseudooceanicola sp. MF1-13 TaxID=3379095 RepID=UPI0038925F7C
MSRPYARTYKRLFDIVATLLLVVVTAPILIPGLAVVLAWVSADGHPALYRQRRIGRNGRVFGMLKIRTMVPGAEQALALHLEADPEARREWEQRQKLHNDPRVTRLGRFLRRTSLDELPQIWNVLRGDMSLVGPRPIMVDQVGLYPGRAYYTLRPGLTGLWQVSARNATGFAERAQYDDRYRGSLSLMGDLSILWRTLFVVLRGTGW